MTPVPRYLIVFYALAIVSVRGDAAEKPSPGALKEFRLAMRFLQSKKGREKGLASLHALIENHPEDIAAKKAREVLRDNGVGEGLRVDLNDRTVFNKRLGYSEKFLLELEERVLIELGDHFKDRQPFYRNSTLRLMFYDSQARYRKATSNIHYSGHFEVQSSSDRDRTLEGTVAWFFPQRAGSKKDRLTRIKSVLYHETTHYLSAVHFARTVPELFEEGLAKFYESRHNTEFYQSYRGTEREFVESNARNGLGAIAKYRDFEKFLASPRGFGKSGRMLERWYGLCYAVVDFLDRGEIASKQASIQDLLEKLEKRAGKLKDRQKGNRPANTGKALLADVVREFYDSDIRKFHAALVNFITSNYKQI